MDTQSIYELRERLRAAAMAGTSLLSEDFRLKRAFENFKPLETASPVFAKIGQLTERLLSPDCQNQQGALLDTITLTDAVICTLGAVEISGKVEGAETDNIGNVGSTIVNAPYSTLKELLEALTTSGGGHYGYVCDMHENQPQLFQDYRVKYTLIQALGASYAELADQVEQWLIEENDKTILPALYRDFDPKGKKEMVRRVKVIGALAGAQANDFYIKMLGEAQKEVRYELINALCYEPRNLSLLFDLSKTEKGKNKEKVLELLAGIQDKRTEDFFRELAKKKVDTVLKSLRNTTTDWSAKLVAEICEETLGKIDIVHSLSSKEKQELSNRLQNVVRAMFGKGGVQICECYKKLLAQKTKIDDLFKETWQKPAAYVPNILQFGVLIPRGRWNHRTDFPDIETTLGKVLHHSLIANPDSDLQAFALEQYQNKSSDKVNVKFLAAAVMAQLSSGKDCTDWLEEQVRNKVLFVSKSSKKYMKAVIEAVSYISWDKKRNGYQLYGTYIEDYYTEPESVARALELPHAKELINWFQEGDASEETDEVLSQLIPLNDETMCKEMGAYFYNRALSIKKNAVYPVYMKKCGWKECKGLGVKAVKEGTFTHSWTLHNWLTSLPGDKDAIMEEARTICNMLNSGQLKAAKDLKAEDLEDYMNKWYMK